MAAGPDAGGATVAVLADDPVAMPSMNMIPMPLGSTSRHSVSHWDNLLITACIEPIVETLYSKNRECAFQKRSSRGLKK